MQQQQQQQQNYHPNVTHLVPLSNYDVTELKLENGHLAIHGLGGLVQTGPIKPTWNNRACDTLESIVHQATIASSGGTWTEDSGQPSMEHGWIGRRTRSDSDYYGKNISCTTTSTTSQVHDEQTGYQRDNDTTVNTWASFQSPNAKRNDDDSNCHEKKQDQGGETTKGDESSRSRSTRPRRIAAIHNQSERKRRDRINQKMKALQRLVPNASKTDKASMLDEVIKYLEQLQAQVQLMSSLRNNMHPQMMIPLGMQQQQLQQQHLHQMSVLARMGITPVVPGVLGGVGMGMGMGMLNVSNMPGMAPHQSMQQPLVHPNPASFLPPFMLPPLVQPKPDPEGITPNANSNPLADPYCALLAQQQSMNMDLFNRMAALYRQQVNSQMTGSSGSPSESNH